MNQIKKKVAVVTGAASGIGYGVAKVLAETGFHVIAADRSASVHKAAQQLAPSGSVRGAELDVTDEAGIKALIASIAEEHGRLDVLVNNAGVSIKVDGKPRGIKDISTDEWNMVLGINLSGAFLCIRESIPLMRANRWGRIINMSSRAGRTLVGTAGVHYAATKAGMIGMSRIIAAEVAPDGITVNTIAPGRIESPMTQQGSDAQRAQLVGAIPVGRIGTADEIGHVVSFLASEQSGYMTGAVLDVNGGTYMP
ncbi:SDR family oxidoreductase [Chitinasiproducens palmae]|uniref:3-oxoacyl-[acyl-carrier protein] reductase n=1 Tax=Chitinasiproducens palmae TaxID=1770053 RepID=A0A1H2PN16_9BURK|nr:SDR family NAD(P)-dependent oxidoreductase [Chitinasiproducens palmae]SDV47172.1 3-oxoacyl-[acyl-carrier protein] reductase [Chitinasiproducens palmae]